MLETLTGLLVSGSLLALGGAAMIASVAAACIWYIFLIVGYWKIFAKAGEASWKAIVPFVNTYTRYKISWAPAMFWIFLVLNFVGGAVPENAQFILATVGTVASIAALVISALSCGRLARSFGHGTGFAVGLFFLEPIFVLILGMDGSSYLGSDV